MKDWDGPEWTILCTSLQVFGGGAYNHIFLPPVSDMYRGNRVALLVVLNVR
jgi:hypothetical protein